VDQLIIRLNNI